MYIERRSMCMRRNEKVGKLGMEKGGNENEGRGRERKGGDVHTHIKKKKRGWREEAG